LTGVAKNQNVAKTQKKQTSERKQKNGHTKKSFLFSTQALKGVVFFCSTRFLRKKKEDKKKEKGYFFFLLYVHGKTCLKCLLLFLLS